MRNATTETGLTLRAAALGGVVLCAALLTAGCSSGGGTEPSGTSRSLSDIFSGSTGSFASTAKPAGATSVAAAEEFNPADCPTVDVRQGASTYSVTAATRNPEESGGLRYQGNFTQTARSCEKNGNTLTIRLGVQGRIILGPAGTPGQVEVPVRFALVQEGVQPKTLWTKFYSVPVTVGDGQPSVTFTHVDDAISVPMPDKTALESYVLYVGFDPMGAANQKKGPPPKRRSQG